MAAEFLLEQANRSVPLEESTLEKSGKASADPSTLTGAVSYDAPYARRQHEDVTIRHASGRRSKWLQNALTESTAGINRVIARSMEGNLQ
jgi:hypothetical protein